VIHLSTYKQQELSIGAPYFFISETLLPIHPPKTAMIFGVAAGCVGEQRTK
jgi:hypothetical protein